MSKNFIKPIEIWLSPIGQNLTPSFSALKPLLLRITSNFRFCLETNSVKFCRVLSAFFRVSLGVVFLSSGIIGFFFEFSILGSIVAFISGGIFIFLGIKEDNYGK